MSKWQPDDEDINKIIIIIIIIIIKRKMLQLQHVKYWIGDRINTYFSTFSTCEWSAFSTGIQTF